MPVVAPDAASIDAEIAAVRQRIAARAPDTDLAASRHRLDAEGEARGLPPGVKVEPVDAGGVPGEWTIPDDRDAERTVLYVHGGGYVAGSIASDRHLAGVLAKEARAQVLSIDYRRAPEYPFPAALDDVGRAYRFLLAKDIAPQRLAIAGVSAGAGLAVAALVAARDQGSPLPACAWLASPWIDLANGSDSMKTLSVIDPVIDKALLDKYAHHYLAGKSPRDPRASPCFGDLHGLPPMLIQVGAAEALLDDAIRLSRVAGAANVPLTLEVWPRMIHGFQLLWPDLSGGREALAAAGRFIREITGESQAASAVSSA